MDRLSYNTCIGIVLMGYFLPLLLRNQNSDAELNFIGLLLGWIVWSGLVAFVASIQMVRLKIVKFSAYRKDLLLTVVLSTSLVCVINLIASWNDPHMFISSYQVIIPLFFIFLIPCLIICLAVHAFVKSYAVWDE